MNKRRKDRQYNGQIENKKSKRQNTNLQNTIYKTEGRAIRTPLLAGVNSSDPDE